MQYALRSLYPSQTTRQEVLQAQEETCQSDCDPVALSAGEIRQNKSYCTVSVKEQVFFCSLHIFNVLWEQCFTSRFRGDANFLRLSPSQLKPWNHLRENNTVNVMQRHIFSSVTWLCSPTPLIYVDVWVSSTKTERLYPESSFHEALKTELLVIRPHIVTWTCIFMTVSRACAFVCIMLWTSFTNIIQMMSSLCVLCVCCVILTHNEYKNSFQKHLF